MLKSYLNKALVFRKYFKVIKSRRLLAVNIYVTDRCNSRCLICHIWRKRNPQDMSLEMFRKILDGVDRGTHLAIDGAELLLHPNIEDFLSELKQRDCLYDIASNGILAERLFELVVKYKIPSVNLSCDGGRETYKKIRGVDNYDNIVWLLGKLTPVTHVRVNYVICPWNTREDLLEVKKLCDRFKVQLIAEMYSKFEYLETGDVGMKKIYKADDTQSFPQSLLLRLYGKWASGELSLPCHSINWSCHIIPDGMVYLCTHKEVPLGSLKEQTLKEIWQSERTVKLHSEYVKCNDCWTGCHRKFDVALAVMNPRVLRRVLC